MVAATRHRTAKRYCGTIVIWFYQLDESFPILHLWKRVRLYCTIVATFYCAGHVRRLSTYLAFSSFFLFQAVRANIFFSLLSFYTFSFQSAFHLYLSFVLGRVVRVYLPWQLHVERKDTGKRARGVQRRWGKFLLAIFNETDVWKGNDRNKDDLFSRDVQWKADVSKYQRSTLSRMTGFPLCCCAVSCAADRVCAYTTWTRGRSNRRDCSRFKDRDSATVGFLNTRRWWRFREVIC